MTEDHACGPLFSINGGDDDDGGDAAEGEEGIRGTGTANRNTSSASYSSPR